jgi:hypothetical protein
MRALLAMVAFLGFSSMAYADGNAVSPVTYMKGGDIGLGLVGQDPSGLTLKLKLDERNAFDFRLGLDGFANDFLLLQGNYIANVVYLARGNDFDLPFYIGGGASFFFFGNDLEIAARVPLGLDLEFANSHLDVFGEIAPQLLLLPGVAPVIDGAVGIRYFF